MLCLQVPSYISRSVAGSYDNEAVAIFALIFTFYLYIKARFRWSFANYPLQNNFQWIIVFINPLYIKIMELIMVNLMKSLSYFMQTLNTGSLFYATLNAIAYFYMVSSVLWFSGCFLYLWSYLCSGLLINLLTICAPHFQVCSWGGYTFIINLIPMHALLCIVTGRYSPRLYIAYCPLVSSSIINIELYFKSINKIGLNIKIENAYWLPAK